MTRRRRPEPPPKVQIFVDCPVSHTTTNGSMGSCLSNFSAGKQAQISILVAGLDQAGKTTLVHALCHPNISPSGSSADDANTYVRSCYAPTAAAAQYQWHCPAPVGGFVSSRTGASGARQENDPAILTNDTAYRIIDAPGSSLHRSSWSALAAEAGSIAFLIYIVDLTDTERMAVARAELDSLISKMGTHRPPLLLVLNKRDAIELGARAAVEDACALHFADFQYPSLTISDGSARDPLAWRRTVVEFVTR